MEAPMSALVKYLLNGYVGGEMSNKFMDQVRKVHNNYSPYGNPNQNKSDQFYSSSMNPSSIITTIDPSRDGNCETR